jgi:hypothetical protein
MIFGLCLLPDRERAAVASAIATVDHADIRGLVPAVHMFIAGLPSL